jgi:hypothetical protein
VAIHPEGTGAAQAVPDNVYWKIGVEGPNVNAVCIDLRFGDPEGIDGCYVLMEAHAFLAHPAADVSDTITKRPRHTRKRILVEMLGLLEILAGLSQRQAFSLDMLITIRESEGKSTQNRSDV